MAKGICAQFPDSAEAASLDITDQSSVNKLIMDGAKRQGRIDAVVNNAYPRNRNYGRKLEEVVYENISLHLGIIIDSQPEKFFMKYNEYCNKKGTLELKDLNGSLLYLLSDSSECNLTEYDSRRRLLSLSKEDLNQK